MFNIVQNFTFKNKFHTKKVNILGIYMKKTINYGFFTEEHKIEINAKTGFVLRSSEQCKEVDSR